MIVMTPQASPEEIAAVEARLETTGVHVELIRGETNTVIAAHAELEGERLA